jgi:NADPH:quinone reductase-like Zn-dependent oxidoreductase
MKYKSIVVTQRGGPEVLQIVENDLRPPAQGEARIRVLAAPLCQDDVAVRVGNRPFLARPPFVPGYSFVGEVDSIGPDVSQVVEGERVAALVNFGAHAEYIYWDAAKLVRVPPALDPAEAVLLILNYLVAFQALQRVAQVKPGDKALIVGASGGVGIAFLQLGRLAGLKMHGLASPSKHPLLSEYGAIPIDYHIQDFVQVIAQAEPGGLDFVFNGMGEEYLARGLAVLRRGGALVHYGAPQSFTGFLRLLAGIIAYSLLPDGKTVKGYGTHRVELSLLKQDWGKLFKLLGEGKIKPVIARKHPILEAVAANRLFESGNFTGNLVLVAPELLNYS